MQSWGHARTGARICWVFPWCPSGIPALHRSHPLAAAETAARLKEGRWSDSDGGRQELVVSGVPARGHLVRSRQRRLQQ